MMEQRNVIIAIALSVVIMIGFNFYIDYQNRQHLAQQQAIEEATRAAADQATPGAPVAAPPGGAPAPGAALPEAGAPSASAPAAGTPAPGAAAPAPPGGLAVPSPAPGVDRAAVLQSTPRIRISNEGLEGSISLVGGRIDDLVLIEYRETVEEDSPPIELLSPEGSFSPYYVEYGWTARDPAVVLPNAETVWTSTGTVLTPESPVVLTWDNGQGLEFTRTISLDNEFLFSIRQEVRNTGAGPVDLFPYGLAQRTGTPDTLGFWILHEGLLGVFDDTLVEVDYDDLEGGVDARQTTGGWLGITDKYWLVALVPDQQSEMEARFLHILAGDKHQVDFRGRGFRVESGQTVTYDSRLFAGAKLVTLLDEYEEQFQIPRFDLAVDFGWFYFLTKPIFVMLHYFGELLGNFGLAILLLTVILKLIFFPLANRAYKSMAMMRRMQPEMMKLKERYGDDRQKFQQEMMALYKKEKINPLSGCLPILLQIPIFFALYKVLFVTIEMRHAPFYGWIVDLSAPDPTSMWNVFGLLPYEIPAFLASQPFAIGALPLIMGFTMYIQQKLNPQPTDPIQAKIFMFLPVIFTIILAPFAAGLVIYWTWNNILSILQQYVIMRRMGVKVGWGTTKAPT